MPEKIKENKGKIVFIIGAVCLAAGAVLLILWLIGISAIKAACSPIPVSYTHLTLPTT